MRNIWVTTISVWFLLSTCILPVSAYSNNENNNGSVGGHEYVDLALPSGTLWAKCNIGAQNEKSSGSFFAWGETKPKERNKYTQDSYKYYKAETYLNQIKVKKIRYKIAKYNNSSSFGVVDKKNELDPTDDAAITMWGENWCMPTEDQFRELVHECQWNRIKENGKWFYKVVGKNQNYIYFPICGFLREEVSKGDSPYLSQPQRKGSTLWDKDDVAFYWSKTLCPEYTNTAIVLAVKDDRALISFVERHSGATIRPVVSKKGSAEVLKSNESISQKWLQENDGMFNAKDLFPFESRSYFPMYYSGGENQSSINQEIFKKMMSRYPQLKATPTMSMELLERDNPKTQHLFLLGYCNYMGLGIPADKTSSYELLREAAVKGDYRCTVMMFALGLTNERKIEDVKLLTKASNAGYVPAMVVLTYIKSSRQPDRLLDPNKYKNFTNEALNGLLGYNYPEAFYLYGKILSNNDYIEKAADMGHLYAIKDMVEILDSKQLYGKAYEYIKKGEQQGFNFNQELLARVRINSRSASDNPQEVAKAMKEAYDMKAYKYVVNTGANASKRKVSSPDIMALYALAYYKMGSADSQKQNDLFNLMKSSAEKGSVYGMEGLAEFYEKGYGLNAIDMQNAFYWYKQAAQKGSKIAQNYLKGRNLKW